MSSNSISLDPVEKSDFYSTLPGQTRDRNRIRLQSLSNFHRLFQDELMEKQRDHEDDPEEGYKNSVKKFYEDQLEILFDETKAGKVLSRYENSQLNHLQLMVIRKKRQRLEVTRFLPITLSSRTPSELYVSYAENYDFNQNYFRNPKGHVYTGKL